MSSGNGLHFVNDRWRVGADSPGVEVSLKATSEVDGRPRVALLLVHGIGEQQPGEFLREFRDGFGRLFGESKVVDIERHDPVEPQRRLHAATIELPDRTICLYEVHWADLITQQMARGSVDPTDLFILAWYPWFNKQRNLTGFDGYSPGRVKSWTARLVPLSVLLFVGYLGLKLLPSIWWAWDTVEITGDRSQQGTPWTDKLTARRRGPNASTRMLLNLRKRRQESRAGRDCKQLEQAARRCWIDRLLDKYAGDVVNLIVSMARRPDLRADFAAAHDLLGVPAGQRPSYPPRAELERLLNDALHQEGEVMLLAERALARFERAAWVATVEDGCSEVQVLGHSLGTLLAYRAMNRDAPSAGAAPDPAPAAASLTRFHTIGSPLEKVAFFWPALVAPCGPKPLIVARGDGVRRTVIEGGDGFQWHNYFSVSDKVSGALKRYRAWGEVVNHRLPGLYGVLSAHVAYKGDARFLGVIARALGAKEEWLSIARPSAAMSWMVSAAQALALPVAVTLVCLLGLMLFAAFGALAAGMFSGLAWVLVAGGHWLFTGDGAAWRPSAMFYWLTAVFAIVLAMSIFVRTPLWARRVARVAVARLWRGLDTRRT